MKAFTLLLRGMEQVGKVAVARIQAMEGLGDLSRYKDEHREALVRLIEAKLNGEVLRACPAGPGPSPGRR